ncbi:MAG: phospho-2-dehydro-3-deoxyheptonate aldolase [Mucinivorans sp.]
MILVAGPCAAESQEQVITTARALVAYGVDIFRASVWKPRTRYGTFEGVGEVGLEWLAQVKAETGMAVATEINMPSSVEKLVEYGIDVAWIGARSSCNPFLMSEFAKALAGSGLRVMVKNPICADLELWIGAIERLMKAGVEQITTIHRGFVEHGYRGEYRNAPLWELAREFICRMPDVPLITDPSHIAGRADLVEEVARQGLSYGARGLMVECHCRPSIALSDASQQLTPSEYGEMLSRLV